MTKSLNLTAASAALKASITFSAEVVGIVDLLSGGHRSGLRLTLSDLNRTATIKSLRRQVATMTTFLDEIDGIDMTQVEVYHEEEEDDRVVRVLVTRTTLDEIFKVDDGIEEPERNEIRAAMRQGREYRGGGGAAPIFIITLAA